MSKKWININTGWDELDPSRLFMNMTRDIELSEDFKDGTYTRTVIIWRTSAQKTCDALCNLTFNGFR